MPKNGTLNSIRGSKRDSPSNKKGTPPPSQPRTFIICTSDVGSFRVVVPSGGHVSFGPNIPFVKKGGPNYAPEFGNGYCVRVYASKSDLLAAFPNVKWFREISIQMDKIITQDEIMGALATNKNKQPEFEPSYDANIPPVLTSPTHSIHCTSKFCPGGVCWGQAPNTAMAPTTGTP